MKGKAMQETAKEPVARKPSRLFIFVLGIGIGVFLTLFIPYCVRTRAEALRLDCAQNMKQILVALHSYHDKYETFPPAYITDENGKPLHSWRVLILPHLGEEELYRQIRLDESWDSEHNSRLHKQMPPVFCCPSDPQKQARGETSYVWMIGEGHISNGTSCTKISQITDGTSNTAMIFETLEPVCWMAPVDASIHSLFDPSFSGVKSIGSNHNNITNIGFADGSVMTLYHPDLYLLKQLSTIAGGEVFVCWLRSVDQTVTAAPLVAHCQLKPRPYTFIGEYG